MSRRVELSALLLVDALGLGTAWVAFRAACERWDWMAVEPMGVSALAKGSLLALGWITLLAFAGLYADRYARGRFDELVTLLKVVTFGSLVLFFGYYLDRLSPGSARQAVALYGASVLGFVAVGRMVVRGVQKALILRGHGRHRAVVVGWSDRVETLYHDLARYPAAGIELVGAVRLTHDPTPVGVLAMSGASGAGLPPEAGVRVLPSGDALPAGALEVTAAGAPSHAIAELPGLIDRLGVQDVLIALGSEDVDTLDQVLRVCDGRSVSLKLVPDFYAAVGGMARTEHIYGLPLIEVFPEPIPAWEKRTKRIADIVVSALVLLLGAPLWLGLAALVSLTSPGGAIYRQKRVGQGGRTFTIHKYRTMVDGAERETGPVWAASGDSRITPLGRWMRKTRLDEVPQFWDVLRGEMSLVGPRPERPFFVDRLADEIPLYSRRHRVQPGITGLAQVKHGYDTDIEDVRQKLKYDLFYIENLSLQMDAKILLQTIKTTVLGKGQ
ncbi:sugar transferase [Rubricoccus marinus]|uniref:Exopolysaccharide biosynthesis polyprenyl glycosylphosphotransferase n=1 Tax=Rubricoccus marinus TaxID=716817 RepID=A0A259U435_9BACT|nr:sugar transferase [Rubricoccus marinus]OZC04607.1 exopolysaccharide biosynthesis polyprenyl glycosylphosphotransferase [Rubricoccus marinus]